MSLSKVEELNLASYNNKLQLDIYDSEKLKPIEVPLFEEWFPGGDQKVLDVGCGVGRTTINLARRGYEVIGIDYSSEMIDSAQKKFPDLQFIEMNAYELKFPDNSFDIVLFSFNGIDCIYPESNRTQAILEMKRVLKPGGKLVLSSHNSIVWPKNKYTVFWWILNLITGRIFTPYRLEYKQYRQGIKFIYFNRKPSRQLREFKALGLKLLDIVTLKHRKKHLGQNPTRTELMKLDLFEEWPYFVLEK